MSSPLSDALHIGACAARHPDKPAYVMAGTGRTVTYRELDDTSNRIAQMLHHAGLRPGDAIAIVMENNAAYFPICWAAQRSGLQYTAISSRLTVGELEYVINDCGARALFTSYEKRDLASQVRPLVPAVELALMVDLPARGGVDGFESLEARLAEFPAEPLAEQLEGGDMLYSSGTTGRPKGVKVPLTLAPLGTAPNLVGLITLLYGFDEDTVYLSPAPLYHAAPLRFCINSLRLGATVVVMEHFDAEQALRLIEQHRVTHSQWVPTMFVRMLKLPDEVRSRYDVSSLKAAVHAAAPCPIPVKEAMIEWWGPIVHEYYAGTEGNGFCAIGPHDWLAHKGSVGKPVNAIVHICDDGGAELPAGEAGTVFFESKTSFEYHNDPEKTAQSRHRKGWSTLGDIGYVDNDGFLYLTDRKANMIISGGVNIYPQEAENVLTMHPKVADVAVFGIPHEEFGEEVKAVVQPVDMADAGPALERELIAFCRERLADLKCPRSVDFAAELPRHPTGKLYKRLLRDRYWEGRTSSLV